MTAILTNLLRPRATSVLRLRLVTRRSNPRTSYATKAPTLGAGAAAQIHTNHASLGSTGAPRTGGILALPFDFFKSLLARTYSSMITLKQGEFVGSLDCGTTSARFIVFDKHAEIVAQHQLEFPQYYPNPGWHEHHPEELQKACETCIEEAVRALEVAGWARESIKAIGITNQRETTVAWSRRTGKSLCGAIVWDDARTKNVVAHYQAVLQREGIEIEPGVFKKGEEGIATLREMTGLPLSTYFSAIKLRWMIANHEEVAKAHEEDDLAFGTVESWLVYNLTDRALHISEVTNASRTLLMNVKTLEWDTRLLKFFGFRPSILPRLVSSSEVYGAVAHGALKGVPIAGLIGDQQGALVGNKCLRQGEAKCTYGTGAFLLFCTGNDIVISRHGLLSTVAYQAGPNAKPVYALEGSIAVAGSAIQWLRDSMNMIQSAPEVNTLAAQVPSTGGVYFVTAFSGLLAPYWDPGAAGLLIGITSYTTPSHIARATLEANAFQTRAVIESMKLDSATGLLHLKVDGGMTNGDVSMAILADIGGFDVVRPMMRECVAELLFHTIPSSFFGNCRSTALGSALLAGSAVGFSSRECPRRSGRSAGRAGSARSNGRRAGRRARMYETHTSVASAKSKGATGAYVPCDILCKPREPYRNSQTDSDRGMIKGAQSCPRDHDPLFLSAQVRRSDLCWPKLVAMAALASVSRCSSLHISAPRLPVFVPQAMRAVQTRTKTTQKPDRKIAQNHKSGKGSYEGGQVAQPKKEKKLGAFRPLSASTLTNPIFKSDQRSELELPAFSNKELGKPTAVGTALEFDLPQNHPFRIFGIPKSMLLEFRLLSKPCSVVRDVTLSAIETMQSAGEKPSSDTRVVLTGAPGCGKSFVLLQSMSHCIQNQWLVMYIPRALNLVNSTTTYAYDMRTQTYLQPAFAFQTLQRFQTVNADALAALTTQGEVELEKRAPLVAGTPLTELISVGLKDQTIAPSVLEAVLTELGKQTTHPVLLAIDDFQALYCTSMYRDTQFSRIKSYHLSMPRLLLEYASGKKTFARGAVLGALSTSHTGFLAPVELRDALGLTHGAPAGPYVKRNAAYVEYARGLRTLPVPDRLSVDEAAALFEVWKEDKAFLGEAPDEMFLAKYTESAGNARNFVGKGLLASLGY